MNKQRGLGSATSRVAMIEDIQGALATLLKLMVDSPEHVQVSVAQPSTLEVRVAHKDVGKVIGINGRTARSLRVILGAIAVAQNARLSLNIAQVSPEM